MSKRYNPILLLASFIIMILCNWLYIRWIKGLFEDVASSWFLLVPFFGYFYIVFAFISATLIYQRKKLGLSLGCFVILFGMIADVMSYAAVFKLSGLYELLIVPLIVLNCLMILYLACYQSYFKSE